MISLLIKKLAKIYLKPVYRASISLIHNTYFHYILTVHTTPLILTPLTYSAHL